MLFWRKKKKIEYEIITANSKYKLIALVNNMLAEGWEVTGNVGYMAVKKGGNQYDHVQSDTWYQSLIRNF